jgi:hypothetical protein
MLSLIRHKNVLALNELVALVAPDLAMRSIGCLSFASLDTLRQTKLYVLEHINIEVV